MLSAAAPRAQVPARVVMPERAAARLREARQHRLELDLLLGQPQQQRLLGAHLVGQCAEALGEREEVGVGGDAALLAAAEDALQILEAVGGLLEQRLDEGRHPGVAGIPAQSAAGEARVTRQPLLEVVVEAVLSEPRLQIEESQHERAGEAEERGAEGGAHAAQGRGEAGFQRFEGARRIAGARGQPADHAADRLHRLQQPVERPEQSQEDEHADQIARGLARLVEPRADAIQQSAHRHGGEAHASAAAVAEHGRHRRQQARHVLAREIGLVAPEALDPGDLGIEPHHLAEDVDDPGDEDAEDHAVHRGIAHEVAVERGREQRGDAGHEGDEDGHPGEIA